MKKGLIRKGLVLSVIVLFIGIGIQPVFANDVSISTKSENEDCIECHVTDDTNGGRFETLCNLLLPLWALGSFLKVLKFHLLHDIIFMIGSPDFLDCYWHPYNIHD